MYLDLALDLSLTQKPTNCLAFRNTIEPHTHTCTRISFLINACAGVARGSVANQPRPSMQAMQAPLQHYLTSVCGF